MLKKRLRKLCLALFVTVSGCVSVPVTTGCTVAGTMSAGAICATTSGETSEMTLDEFLNFLEPTELRGGAICQSAEDYKKQKVALEQACRELGPRCSYELQMMIQGMSLLSEGPKDLKLY